MTYSTPSWGWPEGGLSVGWLGAGVGPEWVSSGSSRCQCLMKGGCGWQGCDIFTTGTRRGFFHSMERDVRRCLEYALNMLFRYQDLTLLVSVVSPSVFSTCGFTKDAKELLSSTFLCLPVNQFFKINQLFCFYPGHEMREPSWPELLSECVPLS